MSSYPEGLQVQIEIQQSHELQAEPSVQKIATPNAEQADVVDQSTITENSSSGIQVPTLFPIQDQSELEKPSNLMQTSNQLHLP